MAYERTTSDSLASPGAPAEEARVSCMHGGIVINLCLTELRSLRASERAQRVGVPSNVCPVTSHCCQMAMRPLAKITTCFVQVCSCAEAPRLNVGGGHPVLIAFAANLLGGWKGLLLLNWGADGSLT